MCGNTHSTADRAVLAGVCRGQAYVGAFMKTKADDKAQEDFHGATATSASDNLLEGEEHPAADRLGEAAQLHDIGTFCQARHRTNLSRIIRRTGGCITEHSYSCEPLSRRINEAGQLLQSKRELHIYRINVNHERCAVRMVCVQVWFHSVIVCVRVYLK